MGRTDELNSSPVSVVVPTWNGAYLLRESLPLLREAAAFVDLDYEVVLVDNGSDDETPDVVASLDLPIRTIRLNRNEGYSYACNVGIEAANHPRVLLLNNDVLMPERALRPLLAWSLGEVFAVGAASGHREQAFGEGQGEWPEGGYRIQLGVLTHCCLLDRAAFLELGGFDLIFSPATWEEMDLGVRVWRSGRRNVLDFRSCVFHYARTTVRRLFGDVGSERLYHRNRLFFLWKNLPGSLLMKHLLRRLPLDCASDVVTRGGPVIMGALWGALRRLPEAARSRRSMAGYPCSITDIVRETSEEGDLESWL